MSCGCAAAIGAAVCATDSRQRGRSPAKKGRRCSRSPSQYAAPSATSAPPSFVRAAATALAAPESRTRSTPASQAVADRGSGWPAHRFTASIIFASSISKASVASAGGRGSTLNESSVSTPSVPSAPAMSRETS